MTTMYETTAKMYVRFGRTADKTTNPPDKSILFWNMETGEMWGVNDGMEWVLLNPPPAAYTGESHIRVAGVATNIFPDALMWEVPALGALIYECRLVIDSAYDVGVTLSVGDAGDNERLMKIADIDPQTPNDYYTPYKTEPIYQYAAGAAIRIYCSSDPTTGSGTLYLFYDENPTT